MGVSDTIFSDYSGAKSFNQDLQLYYTGAFPMGMVFSEATSFKQVLCGEKCFNSKTNKIRHVQGFDQVTRDLEL